jgi:hypothetical protein
MPKGGQRDVTEERRWRQMFANWQTTGLSGAEYCRQNDLHYWEFNEWKRRMRKLDAQSEKGSSPRRHMSPRAQQMAAKLRREQRVERSVEFAEVRMVDEEDPRPTLPKSEDVTALEVVFPNGTKLRLSAVCPLDLLSSVVSILENR